MAGPPALPGKGKEKTPLLPKGFRLLKEGTTIFRLPREFVSRKIQGKWSEALFKAIDRLSVGDAMAKVFGPEVRPIIHRVFLGMAVCLTAYGAGKALALYLSPSTSRQTVVRPPLPPPPTQALAGIGETDLFKAQGRLSQVPLTGQEEKDCLTAERPSSLPVKLVGTIVLMDSVKSLASVHIREAKNMVGLREGDQIPSLALVGKIAPGRLILKNLASGECEYIRSTAPKWEKKNDSSITLLDEEQGREVLESQDDGDIRNFGNTFSIKKSVRSQALANISEVLTQARAVQIKNPDGTLSFKMTEIVPGSIYSKLNIQDGDVVSSINGKKFTNIGEVMGLFNKITEIDQFQLTVDRDGSTQTYEYNLE